MRKVSHLSSHCWFSLGFSHTKMLAAVIHAVACLLADITCLRDLELTVPPAASLGETVVIECSYHLQGEEVGERGPRHQ